MNYEVRTFDVEVRATKDEETGNRYLEGRPIVYNKESRILVDWDMDGLKEFREMILPGALTKALQREDTNVKATWMHERGKLLGTSKSGTLQLSEDEEGVKQRLLVPNTALGDEMYELVGRGDITQMSFKFALGSGQDDVEWKESTDGIPLRVIPEIEYFLDTAYVDEGAYSDTEASRRNLEVAERSYKEFVESRKEEEPEEEINNEYVFEKEARQRELDILNIEIK